MLELGKVKFDIVRHPQSIQGSELEKHAVQNLKLML